LTLLADMKFNARFSAGLPNDQH